MVPISSLVTYITVFILIEHKQKIKLSRDILVKVVTLYIKMHCQKSYSANFLDFAFYRIATF